MQQRFFLIFQMSPLTLFLLLRKNGGAINGHSSQINHRCDVSRVWILGGYCFGADLKEAECPGSEVRLRSQQDSERTSESRGTLDSWSCSCDSGEEIRYCLAANSGEFLSHH